MGWNGWDGGDGEDGLMDRVCGGIMGKDAIYFILLILYSRSTRKGEGESGFVRKSHPNAEMKK